MSDFFDALAYLDLIDPVEGFISTFRYANWSGAYERAGILGLVEEFFSSLAAMNCWAIWISRDSDWSGFAIEKFLARYGVRVWGRGFLGDEIFFRVKKRQARWAEYLLLRRGIPVTSAPFDSRNIKYAARHAPGSEPSQKVDESSAKPGWLQAIRDLFG